MSATGGPLFLRHAVNVPDLLSRDRLIRRLAAIREEAVAHKEEIEHWNRTHPNEQPLDTAFEDAIIAWCDGRGPLPTRP